MELIGMSDYLDVFARNMANEADATGVISYKSHIDYLFNYNTFIKKLPELGDFIPIDKEGNVLKMPEYEEYSYDDNLYNKLMKEWFKSSDRVIFENTTKLFALSKEVEFYVDTPMNRIRFVKENGKWVCSHESVEDLTSLGLTITKTAQEKYKLI